jgi:hypothetical protein
MPLDFGCGIPQHLVFYIFRSFDYFVVPLTILMCRFFQASDDCNHVRDHGNRDCYQSRPGSYSLQSRK